MFALFGWKASFPQFFVKVCCSFVHILANLLLNIFSWPSLPYLSISISKKDVNFFLLFIYMFVFRDTYFVFIFIFPDWQLSTLRGWDNFFRLCWLRNSVPLYCCSILIDCSSGQQNGVISVDIQPDLIIRHHYYHPIFDSSLEKLPIDIVWILWKNCQLILSEFIWTSGRWEV